MLREHCQGRRRPLQTALKLTFDSRSSHSLYKMMNLRDSSLDCWKPSDMSIISQISARSGAAIETGRNRA